MPVCEGKKTCGRTNLVKIILHILVYLRTAFVYLRTALSFVYMIFLFESYLYDLLELLHLSTHLNSLKQFNRMR